jgi:hypothetical protein
LTSTSYIMALAIDPQHPNTVYAGTDGGVFKTTDGGGNWTAVNTGFPSYSYNIRALAIDPQNPNTVYAGTWFGVFKTTNGGGNWTAGLTNTYINALAIDPQNPNTVYAGTQGSGVFVINFSGVEISYSVSGRVADDSSNPIYGVTISDGPGHTTTTDSDGNYTLSGLAEGTYTITPSKSGYTFSPASHSVTMPPDAAEQDFTGSSAFNLPTVTTLPASDATLTSATLNGTVNPNGSDTRAWFEWGEDAELSTFLSTPEQTIGEGTEPIEVTTTLTGLEVGKTYYYRGVGRNQAGTSGRTSENIKNLTILLGSYSGNPNWNKYDRIIYAYATAKNIPAPLLKAIFVQESSLNEKSFRY